MPTSYFSSVSLIIELILFTNPNRILDIGIGFGKYGLLSREYLELWDGREKYNEWTRQIDGIEAFKEYINPVHEFIYDHIFLGNAIDILPNIGTVYDLILLIDVLEHFHHDEGLNLLKMCETKAKNIIVSTPKNIGCQSNMFNNPFETHKFQWRKEHFQIFKDKCFFSNDYSIICYLGENAKRLRRAKINRKIGHYLPFLIPLVKKIKSKKLV